MRDQANIVRWGIPGWTAMVAFIIFAVIDRALTKDAPVYTWVTTTMSNGSGVFPIVIAILLAGTGVPLGFLIYQIYYYIRWSSPPSGNGLFPPFITGRRREMQDVLTNLDRETLSMGKKWRKKILPYPLHSDHLSVSHYVDALLSESLVALDRTGTIVARHRYILDMIHTLGASQAALALGYGTYLFMKSYKDTLGTYSLDISLGIIVITLSLLAVEHEARRKNLRRKLYELAGRRRIQTLEHMAIRDRITLFIAMRIYQDPKRLSIKYPAELFITCLFYVTIIYYPTLDKLVFAASVIIIVSFFLVLLDHIWIWGLGLGATASLGWLVRSIPAYYSWLETRDWCIVISSLVFSSLTIAILKNRQNARDILEVFEHYCLNRFLDQQEEEKPKEESINTSQHLRV